MGKVINSANFRETVESSEVVLIDFWAVWCGPCRVLSPVVDELSDEYAGRVTVAKCNVDDCEEIAGEFAIRSVPTLIFLKRGVEVHRIVGLSTKEEIAAELESLLK